MSKRMIVLALATLLLAACGSAPQRKAGTVTPPRRMAAATSPETGRVRMRRRHRRDTRCRAAQRTAAPLCQPPYVALGTSYTPRTRAGDFKQRGIASWYGKKFHGQRTSSGEVYNMYAMSAAHPTLPLPSYARVTNLANRKSVIVRINDRGPFLHERVIDVSYSAAYKLGIIGSGSAEVEVESLAADVSVNTIPASTVQSSRCQAAQRCRRLSRSLRWRHWKAAAPACTCNSARSSHSRTPRPFWKRCAAS